MGDSYTGLTGLLLTTEEVFAEINPDPETLYVVKGKASFRLYLGNMELFAYDSSAVHSDDIRIIQSITDAEYGGLPEKDPEILYVSPE